MFSLPFFFIKFIAFAIRLCTVALRTKVYQKATFTSFLSFSVCLPLLLCLVSSLAENKVAIVRSGALSSLIRLLSTNDTEVQCNACGCITTLATTETNKLDIVEQGAIPALLRLTCNEDSRVQRNAAGALLNLTHLGRPACTCSLP